MTAALTTRLPDVDDSPGGWRVRAACRAADPDLFFPATRAGRLTRRELGHIAEVARTWCQHCPVRDECGTEADRGGSEGIWDGQWRRKDSSTGRIVTLPLIGRGPR